MRRTLSIICLALAAGLPALLSACATPPPPAPTALLHDPLFAPPGIDIDARQALATSPAMRAFAQHARSQSRRIGDLREALLHSLQAGGQLRLSYDISSTRTAAEAFEAKAGNCLSLALMTTALAREMGLEATLQSVQGEDSYMRLGELVFASGHVNLLLGRPKSVHTHAAVDTDSDLTVDFLPGRDLRGQRVQRISDETALSMFLNNRAAESLEQGASPDAYWWARAAVLQDPAYLPAQNTLGVVYLRHGHLGPAEQAFRHVLAQQPTHIGAMANLVQLLQRDRSGASDAEAAAWSQRLAALQPNPPFAQLDRGRAAMAAGDVPKARDFFTAELRQQPFQPEVHFWLAVAYQRLGDLQRAQSHLSLAADHSSTPAMHALYAGKLQRLRQGARSP